MHPYPHTYTAAAMGAASGTVSVDSPLLPALTTAPPPEFDGPGGLWSPETLLCAAIADCFILTFRGVARAMKIDWRHLQCRVDGTLERVDRQSQFTRYVTHAELVVAPGTDEQAARRALEQAEHGCLVANSLRGSRTLETQITFG